MKNNYKCCNIAVLIPLLSLFFQLGIVPAYPENPLTQQIISGTISDQEGLPLPGVNVIVKGTSTGTMTNLDGKYSIRASIGDTLLFSYVGYQSLQKVITPSFKGDLQMQPANDALSEVVINAGYYNTTERERTGNIARVSGDDLKRQTVISPIEALQGRMAGVEITQRGGAPGGAPIIRIRGQNSLRDTQDDNGNLPLYIIDGVPINSSPVFSYSSSISTNGIDPLNTIGLSNIESIEILKDADATAIYGSRGANGVVLITTKKGYIGKTRLNTRFYTGIGTASGKMDLLNTTEYLDIRRSAFLNDNVEPTNSNAYDLLIWDKNRDIDWQEDFFGGQAEIQSAQVTLSGGQKNTSFRLGSNFYREGTIYPGDLSYWKLSNSLQVNHNSNNNKFNINLSINYGVDTNNLLHSLGQSLASAAINLPPNAPAIYNDNGSLNWEDWSIANRDNPLAGLNNSSTITSRNLISNLSLSYKLFDGLEVKTSAGYTNYNSDELLKMPLRAYNPDSWESLAARSINSIIDRNSWIIEPQLTYHKTIKKHEVNILIGTTFQQNKDSRISLSGYGYSAESQIGNLMNAEDVTVNNDRTAEYRYSAAFARMGYNWDKKLFLNLTGRRDGSSRFGKNNRFANFGAIGAAWIFSEEKFLDNLNFLSFGKLRASYGTTGNDQIGDYGYLDAYEATQAPGGLLPSQLTNPNYSWEENKKTEAAINVGFIKNKLNFELSWYKNSSSNQLVGFPLPSTTGFNSILSNLPATVENYGWELVADTKNISTDTFKWQTSFNISIPKNKLVAFPDIEQTSYANIYRIGHPLNISLLYRYIGINSETGLYEVEDINEDGSFDYADRLSIRDNSRAFYGGLGNTLIYKNVTMQFLWEFVKQNGRKALFQTGNIGNIINQIDEVTKNDNLQKPSQLSAAGRANTLAANSDFSTTDTSFLRLKTISIVYNLPQTLTQKLRIDRGSLFLNGQNLVTFTSYKGLDPQVSGTYIPVLRTFTAGIEFNF
ncbi:SusC/RagA family TonB-linked outer membrane protein [Zunongwangia endophytica]|uniref:SusC/RagA family TonB-linked outer membrane protein n=1 Tax=Zunongwangia endophytica TaxID=1808945 RepID=A0ABV8HEB2_9FLAO|nr:SusC/RagA family TonB-linked outer membrane protein [Zunongwangia endophytica]MDN3596818.1 SusC/RagA family TonB-linked outer membrane protein [Zunongwangia endophytica]